MFWDIVLVMWPLWSACAVAGVVWLLVGYWDRGDEIKKLQEERDQWKSLANQYIDELNSAAGRESKLMTEIAGTKLQLDLATKNAADDYGGTGETHDRVYGGIRKRNATKRKSKK